MKLLKSISLLILLSLQSAVVAQECDDVQLSQAERKYETGNFDEVFELLYPCMKFNSDAQQKMVALRLLALSNFAMDSVENAYQNVSELLEINPSYEAGLFDPPQFAEALQRLRKQNTSIFVTSVSKKAEDIRLSPGTVLVINAKEIKERGYTDLEALMSDLPGFDISRTRGATYSNIYQRGYRGNNTDRTLFMVDGVEDNDLWSNISYFGTQFPLSNIKQVEVIYGPASTMYGPNAFSGVINIITKDPSTGRGGKPYAAHAEVGVGTYNTSYVDAYAAGRVNNAALSVTMRRYQSDYRDLSGFEDYDYSPADYDRVDYGNLLTVGSEAFQGFFDTYGSNSNFNAFYDVGQDANGNPIAIPTELAQEFARNADKDGLNRRINGQPIRYANRADNIFFSSKLQLPHFTFAAQYWKAREGATNYKTDNYLGGADNATVWVPTQFHISGKYENEIIKDKLSIEDFAQYRVTSVDDETSVSALRNYSNGSYGAASLMDSTSASWITAYYYQVSRQFRNELKVTYTPSSKFDLVSGVEIRHSFIQGDYYLSIHTEAEAADVQDFPSVIETGGQENVPGGGNYYEMMEIGAFAQGTYKVNSWINLILGGRYDYNRIRVTGGYGNVFNPRAALVVYPDNYVFKIIYASAFQNASNWTKFATFADRQLTNPTLPPEEVRNIDVSVGYNFNENLFADLTYYNAIYQGSVTPVPVPFNGGTTLQNQAVGELKIQGLQGNVNWKMSNYRAYLNYTFTSPYNNRIENGELTEEFERIGDIASHQINAGVNARYFENLNINLRFNYIGERLTGPGTSVPLNLRTFDPVYLLNGAIMYENLLPGLDLQFGVNNILDQEYSDPGIRTADGVAYAMATPQNRRNYFFKMIYGL